MLTQQGKLEIIKRIGQGGWKAVVFDIDGTLFPRSSADQLIFSMLGELDFMKRFEEDYATGKIDNDVVAVALAAHFTGHKVNELTTALSHNDFIEGAIELSQALRQAGIAVLVATVTYRFIADWVALQLKGEVISGVELEERAGILTGNITRHAHAINKTNGLKQWCSKNHIAMDECIAIGDSRSDLHIFDNVGLSLAINASDDARRAATFAGDFDNLWQLFADAPPNVI